MHIKDRWKVWCHMASLGWKGLIIPAFESQNIEIGTNQSRRLRTCTIKLWPLFLPTILELFLCYYPQVWIGGFWPLLVSSQKNDKCECLWSHTHCTTSAEPTPKQIWKSSYLFCLKGCNTICGINRKYDINRGQRLPGPNTTIYKKNQRDETLQYVY